MVRLGRSWLESPNKGLSDSLDSQVLLSILLAQAHEGTWSEVSELERTLGRDIPASGLDSEMRQLLLALADEAVL